MVKRVGVNMDIKFSSIDELKKRLTPALRNRVRSLKRNNVIMTEDELWNYFVRTYWKSSLGLSLYQMVDDILNREIKHDEVI